MNEYKKILRFARPHQKYIYGSLFFNILYSVFQIASLGAILPVLGMLFGTIKPENYETAPVYSGEITDFSPI
jgi:subfamily B ATP-binding cassette protein MsbA